MPRVGVLKGCLKKMMTESGPQALFHRGITQMCGRLSQQDERWTAAQCNGGERKGGGRGGGWGRLEKAPPVTH